jgi:hypothetical protein
MLAAAIATTIASSAALALAVSPAAAAGGTDNTNGGNTKGGNTKGSAATGQRGVGIRLADASTSRRNDPRAQIYVDDFVRPGSTFVRHVQVSDFTAKPMHLLVYPAPASITADNFSIALRGQRSELTDWITVSPSSLVLRPGQTATVTVKFSVPATAPRGERYGAIVAELPAVAPKPGTVAVATRVGVRVYLAVGPGGEPVSNFTISTLTAKRLPDGTPAVAAKVTNTGGRALDLDGNLSLSNGPGGLRAGPYGVPSIRTLGIGQTGDVLVPLDKQTPPGPWLAKMSLRSGYITKTVTGTITFPIAAGMSAAPVKAVPFARNRNVLVPIAIGLILALLVGLILFLLWKRRKRREEDEEDGPDGGLPPSIPGQRATADDAIRQ